MTHRLKRLRHFLHIRSSPLASEFSRIRPDYSFFIVNPSVTLSKTERPNTLMVPENLNSYDCDLRRKVKVLQLSLTLGPRQA